MTKLILTTIAILGTALSAPLIAQKKMTIETEPFGKTKDGVSVNLYTLTNANGAAVKITNYGGIVTELHVPDKAGKLGDVVLGYDKVEDYIAGSPYFGCITGRYCNRIAKGKFSIDDKEYTLATNNGDNHLHGGEVGFDKKVWNAATVKNADSLSLVLTYRSVDGEEGYPGNLDCKVVYTWTNDNALKVEFTALTDKATHANLTHHGYFNLAGAGSGNVLAHELKLNCSKFVPTDDAGIPTGKLADVKGTPLDFRKPHAIGARVGSDHEQIVFGKGYDHNWCIDKDAPKKNGLAHAATVRHFGTGRVMEVHTDQPGIQFYTGNYLDGTNVGKGGKKIRAPPCVLP